MLDIKKLLTKILDALKVDYIVEEGTDNNWIYRKWHSGAVEAWRYSLNLGSQTGSVWVSPIRYKDVTITFPNGLFSTTPIVIASSATNQWWVADVNGTSTTSASARFCTLASSSQTITATVYARTG